MKRNLGLPVLIGLLVLMTGSVSAGEKKGEGPEIQVPEAELESVVRDEEGLERHGKFGPLSLFGYGELHYNNPIGSSNDQIDFHRMVVGVGYEFTKTIRLRMELDFEHAFKEPELEYAYIEWQPKEQFGLRGGALLVPMGVINEHHEPPLFYSVERPELYRVIIPTTWQEGGGGFFGKLPFGLSYQAYAISMPTALQVSGTTVTSFNGSTGIRSGRGHVGGAPGRDFGGAVRLEHKGLPGLRVGTSAVVGNTGQGNGAVGGGLLSMMEADAKYSIEGIDLEGIFAFSHLKDAGNINAAVVAASPTFTNFVASQMLGFYFEGAYHLFHHLMPETRHDLVLFGRYEKLDTQFSMPAGYAKNYANKRQVITAGLSYLPIPQVAIKADYTFNKNAANTGTDQFNMGLGFYY
ncbi:MAG: hypothetical protein HYS22_00880 [Deltaproteobacteria bacterium]|nr:hypothetical protein [Deltaproteobacteria bacterium]